jgi:2-amino-4-hydroxy-6-hydroxymethyldihydropteridine diphosphokinase
LNQIFLALGSNLGDRLGNLLRVVEHLPPEVRLITQSPIYETEPWGYTSQPHFLNQVIEAESRLSPPELLKYLKTREFELGRRRGIRYGPRVIDIDLLFYNTLIFNSPKLTIPHPKLHERAFVLVPLADIAPDFIHPVFQKTIRELLSGVDTAGVISFESGSQ